MTVYIVLEEDRGIGVMVSGVYPTEAQARAACRSREWVAEALFDDAAIRKECADRAVAWCGQYDGFMPGNDDTELRAAIEGRP